MEIETQCLLLIPFFCYFWSSKNLEVHEKKEKRARGGSCIRLVAADEDLSRNRKWENWKPTTMHWLDTARSFNPAEKIRRSWLTFLFQLFSDLISFMIPDKLLPVAYPKIDSRRTKKLDYFCLDFLSGDIWSKPGKKANEVASYARCLKITEKSHFNIAVEQCYQSGQF